VRDFLTESDSDLSGVKVLEVGSGTGKATLVSVPEAQITFLDLSKKGFEIARKLSQKFSAENVRYIEGDMFKMPILEEKFDFVWNIGTLEHYDPSQVKLIAGEMLSVLDNSGRIAIAVPNHNSLPMLKARLLGSSTFGKYLNFIPGYRADSEKNYSGEDLIRLLKETARDNSVQLERYEIKKLGSPIFVGSNKFFVMVFKFMEILLPQSKFLTLVTAVKTDA
jgi:ubiquinone/menaquinone biosynthesis C-methylase UbiE